MTVLSASVLAFQASLLDPSVENVQWQLERDPALADHHALPTHIQQLLIHRFMQEWFSQQKQAVRETAKKKSSSIKLSHRLSQIRWSDRDDEDCSDDDDDEASDPATFSPEEVIQFFYAVSNMHREQLEFEFESVLVEFKRQLIMDRLAHDRPVAEVNTLLQRFFPLALPPRNTKKQQQSKQLDDSAVGVWFHAASAAAVEMEREVVGEIQDLLDDASPAAVEAYLSQYPFASFVDNLDSYLKVALKAWKLKHSRAKSPVPTRVATSSPPVSADKDAVATTNAPSSSSAKKAAAMRKATAAAAAAHLAGSSLSSGLSSVSKSLELPLTQSPSTSTLSQESKTKRNTAETPIAEKSTVAPLGDWRWDGLVLNVSEVESLLLPSMLEKVSASQIEAQLSPEQDEEADEPMTKEEKLLFKKKRALLDSIHSQTHEQIVQFLKQRKPVTKSGNETASTAQSQKAQQGEMKTPTPSKRKRKFEQTAPVESKEAMADEAEDDGRSEQQKRKQKKVQQQPIPPRTYGRVTRSNSNGSGMSSKQQNASPAKISRGKTKNKRLIESEADFLLTQQPIPSSDVEEDEDGDGAYEDDEDEEMEDSEATPKRSDPIQPIRLASARTQGIASYFKPQPKSNVSSTSPSTRSKRASR